MPIINCPVVGCEWQSDDLDGAFAAVLVQQLQMHDKSAHTTVNVNTTNHGETLKKLNINPPKISVGANLEEWISFGRQWTMFKKGTLIVESQASTALFYCCSEELRTDILRDVRLDPASLPEGDLLAIIKKLSVREENILVQRMKLGKMVQSPGMSVRTFLANLRGQASLCNFNSVCIEVDCNHMFDYSNEIIKDNLIRGLADPEILADLLGDSRTDRSLDEVVAFVSQKEQGKATRNAMGECAGAISMSQNHQKESSFKTKKPLFKCWACGGQGHEPRNDRETREKKCPAWSSTCNKCNVKGHFNKGCAKCSSCGAWGHKDAKSKFCKKRENRHYQTEDENLNTQLCTIEMEYTGHTEKKKPHAQLNALEGRQKRAIDHHVFEEHWIERPSKPHPTVIASLKPLPDDHISLGHHMEGPMNFKEVTVPMVADSGCQSCIIPLHTATIMGYTESTLMPVSLIMKGAISENLGVIGGVAVSISVKDNFGRSKETKQLVYVSKIMTKAFLCREAMEHLEILPHNFPEINLTQKMNNISEEPSDCQCPRRGQGVPPLPTKLPHGITAEEKDVDKLREWLLQYYGSTTFNICEHQPLPMMTGEPLKLHVNPEARPVAVHKPATVPVHWQDKVRQDIERDVRLGVLEKVSPNTPVTWCSRMVVACKADGTPRRTVDLQPQNRNSVRQTHHVQPPFRLAESIPQGTRKTVTDAWNGYHSVPLCEEDRHITTFITPWGRYRYKVAPQGFLASGDGYTQRFDALITDFPDKVKCVDDTCMWAEGIEAAFFQTCRWLDLCARNGVTLVPKKFQFAKETVDFAGLTITPTNVRPNKKFIDSISEFPTPKDITGARAWFGLVNQGAYAFSVAKEMLPFRHLLKPDFKFEWTEELETLFKKSKEVMIKSMEKGVRLFDPKRTTMLSTDWSNDGIGFMLRQKYCDCPVSPTCCLDGWRLALVGSRFTTPTESRYAPIEGEALAVAYSLNQTKYYVLGCSDLIVTTDHKPLLNILNDKSLNEISNRRLLNLKEKTLQFKFTIHHVSGAKNKGPDAASRYPGTIADHEEDLAEDKEVIAEATDTLYITTNMVTWKIVQEETAKDETLKEIMRSIRQGFQPLQKLQPEVRPFHRYAEQLYILDGVVMLGQKIVIPETLRDDILQSLHAAHQGIGAMNERAADTVFWPGISIDITRVRNDCAACHRIAKSNAMEPSAEITQPEYPFQMICCDYFQHEEKNYLVSVDRYSHWPTVFQENGKAENLVKRLRDIFITFGIPEELTSDGGPQFTAGVTQEFLKAWGIHHRLTSVANPHANSRAEIAVKTVKRMIMTNTSPTGSLNIDSFQRAILIYRNSIDPETKTSPAMTIFGRPIRDSIPAPLGKYCPHPTWKETIDNREKAMAKRHFREKEKWDKNSKLLQPLQIGDHVYLQNLIGNHPLRWERTGVILEDKPFHQYLVKYDGTGRVTLRNRKHIRKFTPFVEKAKAAHYPEVSHDLGPPPRPMTVRYPEVIEPTPASSPKPMRPSHSPLAPSQPLEPISNELEKPRNEMYNQDLDNTPPDISSEQTPENHLSPERKITEPHNEQPKRKSKVTNKGLPLALRRLLPHNNEGMNE